MLINPLMYFLRIVIALTFLIFVSMAETVRKKKWSKYNSKFITKTIDHYRTHGYNISLTSTEMNISKNTLRSWIDKYAVEHRAVVQQKGLAVAQVSVDPFVKQVRDEVLSTLDDVKTTILQQMIKVIPATLNLDHLSRAYKVLHDCSIAPSGDKLKELPEQQDIINIILMQSNAMQGDIVKPIQEAEYEQVDD